MKRLCIYPKDVQLITGKSPRYGRYLIEQIKRRLGKQHQHLVTIKEFCEFTGLPQTGVEVALGLTKPRL